MDLPNGSQAVAGLGQMFITTTRARHVAVATAVDDVISEDIKLANMLTTVCVRSVMFIRCTVSDGGICGVTLGAHRRRS